MSPRLISLFNRLEVLSTRERVMTLVGIPLLLLALCEVAVFAPARKKATESGTRITQQRAELDALQSVLQSQPVQGTLPAVGQLQRQREQLRTELDAAQDLMSRLDRRTDWGSVVRASAEGRSGVELTQLKTQAPEVVFSPAAAAARAAQPAPRTAAAPASAPASATVSFEGLHEIYRHHLDFQVQGELSAVLGYLQALRRLPGGLRWDKVQLSVISFPQVTAQLSVSTLSTRPETPFN